MSRNSIIIILAFIAETSFASGWEKVLSCDGGSTVVDVDTSERRNLQVVIKNLGVLRYLNETRAASLRFGQSELIIKGRQENGVFYPGDFHSMLNEGYPGYGQRITQVSRNGSDLFVQFNERRSYVVKPEWCRDCLSPSCESACEYRHYDHELANWIFRGCE